jgi:hypothetical protein
LRTHKTFRSWKLNNRNAFNDKFIRVFAYQAHEVLRISDCRHPCNTRMLMEQNQVTMRFFERGSGTLGDNPTESRDP